MSSNAASTIRSHRASVEKSALTATPRGARRALAGLEPPRFDLTIPGRGNGWRPACAAASLVSTTTTRKPASAKATAIPAPIVPAPITPTLIDPARRDPFELRRARRLALGGEDVAHRLGLIAAQHVDESGALARHALRERQFGGEQNGARRQGRRGLAARFFLHRRQRGVDFGAIEWRRRDFAQAPDGLADGGAGQRNRRLAQVALGDRIGDAERQRLLGLDLPPARRQIDGVAQADQARQALRAAGAGNEAELDLGQADPRLGVEHARVAGQRQLEAAAERRAMDRGDHRLFRGLDDRQDVRQRRGQRRLAKFADVGASDEGAPLAGDDHRLDRRVGVSRADRARQALANRLRGGVDRRIVDQHQSDGAPALGPNDRRRVVWQMLPPPLLVVGRHP